MTIKTLFDIKSRVRIKDLNKQGTIIAIYVSEIGNQYSVRFLDGTDYRSCYFFEEELDLNLESAEKPSVGF